MPRVARGHCNLVGETSSYRWPSVQVGIVIDPKFGVPYNDGLAKTLDCGVVDRDVQIEAVGKGAKVGDAEQPHEGHAEMRGAAGIQEQRHADPRPHIPARMPGDFGHEFGCKGPFGGEPDDVVLGRDRVAEQHANHGGVRIGEEFADQSAGGLACEGFAFAEGDGTSLAVVREAAFFGRRRGLCARTAYGASAMHEAGKRRDDVPGNTLAKRIEQGNRAGILEQAGDAHEYFTAGSIAAIGAVAKPGECSSGERGRHGGKGIAQPSHAQRLGVKGRDHAYDTTGKGFGIEVR